MHQYGEYGRHESLDQEVLNRFKYTECRSPLIVPVPFNKEGENMIRMLQLCVSKNIQRIHLTMDNIIIALKSAKNKSSNPYSLDKQISAYHDQLDALRLALCYMRAKQ